jgi:hypothetical protein
MELTEDTKEAKDILQNIIKSKKTIRMYPQNNPVYVKTLEDSYSKLRSFFDYKDNLSLKIKQNSIYYDAEQIYYNPDKEDNLALFFFKDGLREITFKSGLLPDELEEFLKIISLDFDRDAIDDDIVTLLWEKDFQNIHYIVDEAFLIDADEEDYQAKTEEKAKEKVTDVDDLMKAYTDGFMGSDVKTISVVPLTDNDLHTLVKELEKDSVDKTEKLFSIIFEMIYQKEGRSDLDEALLFLKDTIRYAMKHGEIRVILDVMKKSRGVIDDPSMTDEEKKLMKALPYFLGDEEIVGYLADVLESGIEIDGKVFEEFTNCLEKNSIPPLVKYLGELATIRARKYVIEALTVIGRRDVPTLAKGLDDQRWYVVRNIIYILRKIADKRGVEYLLRIARHADIRVRKEVIKTLGELGGREVVQTLRECLDDADMQVRVTAAKAFASIGSEAAKKIMLEKISGKDFKDKNFEEKREFFEVISRWKDSEVFDFLMKILKARSFFSRTKLYESKACAAFSLGLMGNKDALPALDKFRESGNKLMRDFACAAIKKIEYGQ